MKNSGSTTPKKKFPILWVIIPLIVLLVSVLVFLGISKHQSKGESQSIQDQIKNDGEIFKSSDVDRINSLLFSEEVIPEDFKEFVEPVEENDIGLMADLIALAEIEFVSQSDTSVTVSIEAPDMSRFGDELLQQIDCEMDEAELKELILQYARNSGKQTREVTLQYTTTDGAVSIDYHTADFLNAITGNIASGYQAIYEQYIEELIQEVDSDAQ